MSPTAATFLTSQSSPGELAFARSPQPGGGVHVSPRPALVLARNRPGPSGWTPRHLV